MTPLSNSASPPWGGGGDAPRGATGQHSTPTVRGASSMRIPAASQIRANRSDSSGSVLGEDEDGRLERSKKTT